MSPNFLHDKQNINAVYQNIKLMCTFDAILEERLGTTHFSLSFEASHK